MARLSVGMRAEGEGGKTYNEKVQDRVRHPGEPGVLGRVAWDPCPPHTETPGGASLQADNSGLGRYQEDGTLSTAEDVG